MQIAQNFVEIKRRELKNKKKNVYLNAFSERRHLEQLQRRGMRRLLLEEAAVLRLTAAALPRFTVRVKKEHLKFYV